MKYCKTCGAEMMDDEIVCPKCGSSAADAPVALKKNKLAIAGFILGIAAFPFSFYTITAIVGLVLSILGYVQIKKGGYDNKKMAVAGIIISAVAIVWSILYTFVIAPIMMQMLDEMLNGILGSM